MKTPPLLSLLLALLSLSSYATAETLALWSFAPTDRGRDLSGHENHLQLRGEDSRFIPDDRFGGALLIEEQLQPGDAKQGVQTRRPDKLNPEAAFAVELWVQPTGAWSKNGNRAVLIDKKYYYSGQEFPGVENGYLFSLRQVTDGVQLEADCGFGTRAERVASDPVVLTPNRWHHLIFAYDGIRTFRFYLNGALVNERTFRTGGSIAPSKIPLIIGDRYASMTARFLGRIANVRLYSGEEEIPAEEELRNAKP